jgi:hypothetical protein
MKKPIDAIALRGKIEGLYKGKDLSKDDDKKIIRYDKVAIANSERIRTEEEKEKSRQSNKKFREENPRTEEEKYACGNNMRGKKLEEILGEERAATGKEARRQANFKQDYTGRGDKTATTRKANGSYESDTHGMNGKTHKESTKAIQGQKAKIRQELKRELGLGKSDSVPKDLLEKEYEKQGLK